MSHPSLLYIIHIFKNMYTHTCLFFKDAIILQLDKILLLKKFMIV